MKPPASNVVRFPRRWRYRGREPSLEAIQLAIEESLRLGEPINADKARQLLIELYISGDSPE